MRVFAAVIAGIGILLLLAGLGGAFDAQSGAAAVAGAVLVSGGTIAANIAESRRAGKVE
jgi:hypothetical protein